MVRPVLEPPQDLLGLVSWIFAISHDVNHFANIWCSTTVVPCGVAWRIKEGAGRHSDGDISERHGHRQALCVLQSALPNAGVHQVVLGPTLTKSITEKRWGEKRRAAVGGPLSYNWKAKATVGGSLAYNWKDTKKAVERTASIQVEKTPKGAVGRTASIHVERQPVFYTICAHAGHPQAWPIQTCLRSTARVGLCIMLLDPR